MPVDTRNEIESGLVILGVESPADRRPVTGIANPPVGAELGSGRREIGGGSAGDDDAAGLPECIADRHLLLGGRGREGTRTEQDRNERELGGHVRPFTEEARAVSVRGPPPRRPGEIHCPEPGDPSTNPPLIARSRLYSVQK